MTNEISPTPKDDDTLQEQLVAYLDGELDPSSSAAIEQRLSEEAEVRLQLMQLQQTWDMLDVLPQSQVGDSFTQSTVELVALRAADDVDDLRVQTRRRTRLGYLVAATALLLVGVVGYLVVYAVVSSPNRRLLADLPVVHHLDVYRHVESVEFLQLLDKEGLFAEQSVQTTAMEDFGETLSARQQRLAAMPASEKLELERKKERFDRLTPEQQDELRQLHETVQHDPQSERLQQVMLRYNEWLKTLAAGQRAELLSLPAEERVHRIRDAMSRQEEQLFIQMTALELEPDEVRMIYDWLHEFVQRHEAKIISGIPERDREWVLKHVDEPERRSVMMYGAYRRHNEDDALRPDDNDIKQLGEKLRSPKAREALTGTTLPHEEKLDVIRGWMRAAYVSRSRQEGASEEELSTFYEGLQPAEKDYLESLPSEQMRRQLQRMYYFKSRGPRKHGKRDHDRGHGDHRRDDHGPGRPPEHRRGPEGPRELEERQPAEDDKVTKMTG